MNAVTQLELLAGFGQSLSKSFLLAYHPQEWANGEERTLLFELNGGSPRFVAELPFRAVRAWQSSSGSTYFLSYSKTEPRVDAIHVHHGGPWSNLEVELDSTGQKLNQHHMHGISGSTSTEDTVFVTGAETTLFVRRRGSWDSWMGPDGCDAPNGFHGIAAGELYLGSPELGVVCWDGNEIVESDSPMYSVEGLVVVSQSEILATQESSVWRWTADDGWDETETPYAAQLQPCLFQGALYSATYDEEGVVELDPTPQVVAPIGDVRSLVDVGDGLIASGADGAVFFDGKTWTPIAMPTCPLGGRP